MKSVGIKKEQIDNYVIYLYIAHSGNVYRPHPRLTFSPICRVGVGGGLDGWETFILLVVDRGHCNYTMGIAFKCIDVL